jgi:hypothetical protein
MPTIKSHEIKICAQRRRKIAEDMRAAEAGVAERKETYSTDKKRSYETALIVGKVVEGATSALSFGLAAVKTGSFPSVIAAIGIPAALIAASAYLVHACRKQISDMKAQQIADEAMLAKIRKAEVEAQKAMLDFTLKLEQFKSVNVEDVLESLHQAERQLKVLRAVLLEIKHFWETLASVFFLKPGEGEVKFETYSKIDANKLHCIFNSSSFEDVRKTYLQ